jgi:hypothetical protein
MPEQKICNSHFANQFPSMPDEDLQQELSPNLFVGKWGFGV